MSAHLLILAANEIELVMLVIFIVISIISALGKAMGKGKKENQQAARRARPQAPRPQQPAGGGRPQAGGIEDEIGEFLRRASQGRGGDQAAARRPAAQPPVARPVPQRPPQPVARPSQRPVVAEVAHERLAQEHPSGAETRQTARRFSGRAKELGKSVAQADAQSDQHVHEVFDHDISSLTDTSVRPEDAGREAAGKSRRRKTKMPQTAAAGVAAMLADAQGIRQAILINEILQRPTDRWS